MGSVVVPSLESDAALDEKRKRSWHDGTPIKSHELGDVKPNGLYGVVKGGWD